MTMIPTNEKAMCNPAFLERIHQNQQLEFGFGNGIVQKQTTVLFLIDISGSMSLHSKLEQVWKALKNVTDRIKELANAASVHINILTFSDHAQWLFTKPVCVKSLSLGQQPRAESGTDFALLFDTLDAALTTHSPDKSQLVLDNGPANKPVIILMSDGQSTTDYTPNLQHLSENAIFKQANRVSIGFAGADKETLIQFAGDESNYHHVDEDNLDQVANLVKNVSTLAIMKATHPAGMSPSDIPNVEAGAAVPRQDQNLVF